MILWYSYKYNNTEIIIHYCMKLKVLLKMNSYVLTTWTLLFIIHSLTNAAPPEDLVTNVPGLPTQPTFKHYSGYLNSTGNNFLHYWFVESQSETAATDPVILWLNGGPGCSSLTGLLAEHGPFRLLADGETLRLNEYAWNQVANVLYLESPAGVGYSYTVGGDQPTDDDDTARQNLAALKDFLLKFPEYASNELFITGESYGGIYVPTLSALVIQDGTFNFKGFAIGNGMHSWDMDDRTSLINEGFHALYPATTLQRILKFCCNDSIPDCDFYTAGKECNDALNDASSAMENTECNPYYIYDTCEGSLTPFIASKLHFRYRNGIHKVHHNSMPQLKLPSKHTNFKITDPDCTSTESLDKWLNNGEVRTALHIPSELPKWLECGGPPYDEIYYDMTPFYKGLLSNVRALIYNGDADTVCNYLHAEYFFKNLKLPLIAPYQAWNIDSTTVGYSTQYENLTVVTIMNAGHMSPSNKPVPALEMIKKFITNTPF